ncbi:MAG: SAM-dependent methyltransferase [Deltaproteobacteria bacterium]|nr:MAG: SAM-dependent methyltransferase [Deltaproteobacteria bacterium]
MAEALAAPDRDPADVAQDAQRDPAQTFGFFGIAPGMKVAELGAGGGYTAEILARIVTAGGAPGKVYGNNSPFILERFAEKPWSERLKKPVMKAVTRLDTPFDAPFPAGFADQGALDAVLVVLFYHDTVWQEVDRAAMNKAVFAALKPGGVYGIVDHAARPEDGTKATKTLHRITRSAVIEEVRAVGFVFEEEAGFLRNPDDPRDWDASPSGSGERRGTSDRFVLRFKKPAAE